MLLTCYEPENIKHTHPFTKLDFLYTKCELFRDPDHVFQTKIHGHVWFPGVPNMCPNIYCYYGNMFPPVEDDLR